MDLSGLLAALESGARVEAEAVARQARSEAAALAAEGARRRDSQRARAKAEADAALAASLDDALRAARKEAAGAALRARQEFLDEVLRLASARLPGALDSAAYQGRLGELLDEALEYAGGEDPIVSCAPALLEPLRRLAAGRALVEADAAISDGFQVSARKGSLRIDARLSSELRRRWPEMAVGLGAIG